MSYLHPNKEDSPEKAILCSRIIARALGFYLLEGEGINIKLDKNDFIVYVKGGQVLIESGTDKPDGSKIHVIDAGLLN